MIVARRPWLLNPLRNTPQADARLLHITDNLLRQLIGRCKGVIAAYSCHKLHGDLLAIEIAGLIQQIDFDQSLARSESRPGPDVSDRII